MKLMNKVFSNKLDVFVSVQLVDILIYSKKFENLKHLEKVPKKLRAEILCGKLSKSIFAVSEVEYLGHLISSKGVPVGRQKV